MNALVDLSVLINIKYIVINRSNIRGRRLWFLHQTNTISPYKSQLDKPNGRSYRNHVQSERSGPNENVLFIRQHAADYSQYGDITGRRSKSIRKRSFWIIPTKGFCNILEKLCPDVCNWSASVGNPLEFSIGVENSEVGLVEQFFSTRQVIYVSILLTSNVQKQN